MIAQKNIPLTRKTIYDYISLDGKELSDIIEIQYTWQQLKEDDDDEYLIKKYSLNEISLDEETKEFTIEIDSNDFENVVDNQIYYEIFSIKYEGDDNFRDKVLKNADGDTYATIDIRPAWTQ